MANLTETATYEAGIYRFETTDPVQGGPGGIDNLPTNQLANRTAWLKAQVEAILADIAAIESGYATAAALVGHTSNTSNPHGTTKAQVGLGSVENYGIASQAEAEAGASDIKYMTPLKAKQAIAKLVPAASDTVAGLIEHATAAEAQALADTMRALTPATLAQAFMGANRSLSSAGYQRLPGGLVIQWLTVSIPTGSNEGTASASLPTTFPTASIFAISSLVTGGTAASWFGFNTWVGSLTASSVGVTLHSGSTSRTSAGSVRVIAIGY